MQKTISYALYLLLVTGLFFTACDKEDPETVKEVDVDVELDMMTVEPRIIEVEEVEDKEKARMEEIREEMEEIREEMMEDFTPPMMDTGDYDDGIYSKEGAYPPMMDTGDYDDGTYSKDGSYTSPAGPETIGVTLTIEDDIVTNVSIRKDAAVEKSMKYQTLFADGISVLVVGKKLDEIGTFSSVNGSSLTPRAFQAALERIKSDAED